MKNANEDVQLVNEFAEYYAERVEQCLQKFQTTDELKDAVAQLLATEVLTAMRKAAQCAVDEMGRQTEIRQRTEWLMLGEGLSPKDAVSQATEEIDIQRQLVQNGSSSAPSGN